MTPLEITARLVQHCEHRPPGSGRICGRCWSCLLAFEIVGETGARGVAEVIQRDTAAERRRLLAANEARLAPRAKNGHGGNGTNGAAHFLLPAMPTIVYEAEDNPYL